MRSTFPVAAALMLGGASATATYYDHGTCVDYAIASDDVYTGAALGFEFDSLASTCCYTYDDNACSHTPTGVPTPMPSSAPTSAPTPEPTTDDGPDAGALDAADARPDACADAEPLGAADGLADALPDDGPDTHADHRQMHANR